MVDSQPALNMADLSSPDLWTRMAAENTCLAAGALSRAPLSDVAGDAAQPAEARWRAAMMLGELNDDRPASLLIDLSADPDHDTRQSAIWALGWLRCAEGFDSLLRVASNEREDEQVRFVAACSLVAVDTDRAERVLAELLLDAPDGVRRAARAALANLAERRVTSETSHHD
ncbi:MAG: HEAT repeat domain-containing protein [Anaerolineae bacterium]|nr:HEAT repeat domain-containing protein [Anaerolineae bacterium]